MSTDANKHVVKRMYQIFSSGEFEDLRDVISDDFVDHDPDPGQEQGAQGVIDGMQQMRGAFPDMAFEPQRMVAEGDVVSSHAIVSGTHQKAFMGVPPTAKEVTVELIEMFRIEDGRVVERWAVMDRLAMLVQLGVVDVPGPQ